jgi:hypothetical protein
MFVQKVLRLEKDEYPKEWKVVKVEDDRATFNSEEIKSIYGDTVVFEFTVFLSGDNHSPQYPNFRVVNDSSIPVQYFSRIETLSWGKEPVFFPTEKEMGKMILNYVKEN